MTLFLQNNNRIQFNDDNVAVLNDRISMDDTGTLYISDAELSDSGEYSCRAENGNGKPVAVSATVDVIKETEVIQKPTDELFVPGKDITFDCDIKVSLVKANP